MDRSMLLEAIALDAADADAAQSGGADRLELVRNMAADGLTPDVATVRSVLAATDLPVRVMLRDAPGFLPADLDALRRGAAELRELGVNEFVLGWLTPTGRVDVERTREVLAELGDDCRWTFHRAVDHAADHAADYTAAWGEVVSLGPDTVLTAGAHTGVEDGLDCLRKCAARQDFDEVTVLAGGGLKAAHVAELRSAGVRAFHVGSGVRDGGWSAPVSADRVRAWRSLLDA